MNATAPELLMSITSVDDPRNPGRPAMSLGAQLGDRPMLECLRLNPEEHCYLGAAAVDQIAAAIGKQQQAGLPVHVYFDGPRCVDELQDIFRRAKGGDSSQ